MVIEFTIQVTITEVIDMWKLLLNVFYKIIEHKGSCGGTKMFMQIQKEVLFLLTWLFILFAQQAKDFALIWIMHI